MHGSPPTACCQAPIEGAGGPAWRGEAPWLLLVPALVTAALAAALGLLAEMPLSALDWARRISIQEFGSWSL